ncbi:Serine/threonine phosphatase stp [Gimesia panareensis]|uniref:Serine/threonine phosphatase stp n=1 Tax=Gimesia panareensis TaxID=2527978 RepID=A0A518FMF0_9PLAN|nr:protein phosphatase 2C domain-containing protein [Gimesia panareensis]QDV17534.1 Serine/threonine phosphatase stp [Gimesia panareensis]
MSGKMDCFGLTKIGSHQTVNQDQFLIADLEKSMRLHSSSLSLDSYSRLYGNSQAKLLLVSDGIGDSGTGDLASRLVTEHLTRYLLNEMPWFLECDSDACTELQQEFLNVVEQCQERMEFDIEEHPERTGMEATLTLGYLIWPVLTIVHVGHSRCYLYRDSRLSQLTQDHNLTERLVKSGALNAGDLPEVWQEMPFNVIGGDPHGKLSPQIMQTEIKVGDTLMLCTDGLTRQFSDTSISEILSRNLMADETCIQLINEAQACNGTDNMTVIVARFLDVGDQDVALSGGLQTETDLENMPESRQPQKHNTPGAQPEKQQP